MKLSDQIRWCEIDSVIIVLDIVRGEYFALDPDTARAWQNSVVGNAVVSDALYSALYAQGWLETDKFTPAASRPVSYLSGLTKTRYLLAFACIVAARLRLKYRGFANAYGWARNWRHKQVERNFEIKEDLKRFISVEAYIPSLLGDRDCLPRSLALYVYMRALGHDVRHVIGVSRFPFDAHAWVEFQKRPLLEFIVDHKLLPNARKPKGRTPIAVIG